MLAQSGGLLAAALDQGHSHGVGLSAAVSIGDRADISSNDFVQWWEQDRHARDRAVPRVLRQSAQLRPDRSPRRAREADRRGRAGRAAAGATAGAAPTGSLVAETDRATDALFRHAGVIRTDTFRELLDVAALLASQPLPRGHRVGRSSPTRAARRSCARTPATRQGCRCRRCPRARRTRCATCSRRAPRCAIPSTCSGRARPRGSRRPCGPSPRIRALTRSSSSARPSSSGPTTPSRRSTRPRRRCPGRFRCSRSSSPSGRRGRRVDGAGAVVSRGRRAGARAGGRLRGVAQRAP